MNTLNKFVLYAVFVLVALLILMSCAFFVIYHEDSRKKHCLIDSCQVEFPVMLQSEKCVVHDSCHVKHPVMLQSEKCVVHDSCHVKHPVMSQSKECVAHDSCQVKHPVMSQSKKCVAQKDAVAIDSLRRVVTYNEQKIKYISRWVENYQMEVDLMIDKNSQWLAFWTAIIAFVLTLVTILLTYVNYKTNDDNKNMIKESIHCLESSTKSNHISSITSCISCFLNSLVFTPETERHKYIGRFLHILYREYSEYITFITELTGNDRISDTDFLKERDYVYLCWCDISTVINSAVYDFHESDQIIAYDNLHDTLTYVLLEMHGNRVTRGNIVQMMQDVIIDFERLINTLRYWY